MMIDQSPPDDLRSWVHLIANQEPRQATLHVPQWMADHLAMLTEDERIELLADVTAIAAQHGLLTPVVIEVIDDAR